MTTTNYQQMKQSFVLPNPHSEKKINGIKALLRNLFMTYADDKTLKIWNARETKPIAELHEMDIITDATYHKETNTIVYAIGSIVKMLRIDKGQGTAKLLN